MVIVSLFMPRKKQPREHNDSIVQVCIYLIKLILWIKLIHPLPGFFFLKLWTTSVASDHNCKVFVFQDGPHAIINLVI